MSSSLHQHTHGIIGYEHKRFEYKGNELIIHICRKKRPLTVPNATVPM
ncbi:hypothetical protein PQO01_13470 [Lentisphaera marina]|nr:hypothetical protein [Lentisphaera marina]MDD7983843.1 hypothetical protein [Lentisphaera marina]MDD7985035.1 hypothetical protein [Lentisphaera marina]MDD7985690.1 hypothetical protein [Lentisphaera marina]MDD7985954.1 hypothetical protein [Lentisphaera marina]